MIRQRHFVFCIALTALTILRGAAQSITSFQAGDGGWQLAAPAVGNIDADALLEIVLAYRDSNGQWKLDAYKPNGTRIGGFPYSSGFEPINVSPTLFDLDGDGANEILFTTGANIVALRGNASVMWKQTVNAANYRPDAGFQAVTNGFYVSVLGPLQSTLPLTSQFFSEVSPPIVADLEGDGRLEVLTAWKINPDTLGLLQDFNPFINDVFGLSEWGRTGETWSGGVVVSDAATGAKKFIYHFHQLVEAGLAVAQLDSDPALEVLVLNDADSVVAFDKTQPPGLFGKGMLRKKFGKNLRLLSGSYLTGVDLEAADIDGDGLDEVLVPTTQINPNWQPSESILDDDGALMWRQWKQPVEVQNNYGWFNNAALIPVNPDHDNHLDVLGFTHSLEITFRYWNGVELVSHNGWPKSFAPFLPTPPVCGDVDGDGIEDIVIATYDPVKTPSTGKLYVFALNGTEKYEVDIPGGVKHIPSLADVDQDGRTEIVLRSLAGKVYVVKFGSGGTGEISWATHRGSAARNVRGRDLYRAGTPIVTSKSGGFHRASFSWSVPPGFQPTAYRIVRAEDTSAPFSEIATLSAGATSFTATGLPLGEQSIFEVRAVYGNNIVRSVPFAIRSDLNNNLVVNGGFEENDNSHWDKWFTGDIPWTNMTTSANSPHNGKRSMEIRLQNHNSGSSITQYSHYGTPEDYIPVTPGVLYSFGGFLRSSGFNRNTEHWFEWDSSRTAENTNARPALPWPNYFTPPLKAPSSATPWTYLNRTFEMPAGFPNVELRHRYQTDGPASGSVFIDDVFFRPLPAFNDPTWGEWISFGSTWRYLTSTPPAGWMSSTFNDSAWPSGKAKLGQGTGPQSIVTSLPKNQPAYYFRGTFNATLPAEELLLGAHCTDDYGGVVYPMRLWLNGAEIPGPIEAVSGEGNVTKYFDLAPFIDLLIPGQNTIAITLNNTWQPDWDNVAFDISLRAIVRPATSSASITKITRGISGGIVLHVAASAPSHWRLESSSNIGGAWTTLENVNFAEPGTMPIQAAAGATIQFYRLSKTD